MRRRDSDRLQQGTWHRPQPLREDFDVTDMLACEQVDAVTLLEGGYRKEKSKRERMTTGGGAAP